ncbi:MAG TPA: amino acid adenylation domain-containing protein [Pyrinomonadaceae bacterium]|nr:amino acid adenylation domain-containing protein [Pyrinomonadaceae bacterium]
MERQNQTYELTPTQQAMLLYSLYAPRSKAYFEQVCYSYRGPLDRQAFAKAWQSVVDRHSILRTGFSCDNPERPTQIVYPEATLPFQHLDWRELLPAQQQEQLDQFLEEDRACSFTMEDPPLLRVALLQTQADAYWIVVSNHHIILDGWSMSVVRNEVSQLYRQYARQNFDAKQTVCATFPVALECAAQFSDYVEWSGKLDQNDAQAFWRRELEGFSSSNKLPIDKASGQLPSAIEEFAEKQITLSAAFTNELSSCAKRNHLTISTILQAAWAVVLSRYSATNDVLFGITVAGRPYELPGIEKLVGLLINTLPLRIQIVPEEPCLSTLQKVRNTVSGLLEHEQSSLTKIQQWCDAPRNLPLFETLVVFENFAGSGSSFELNGPLHHLKSHLSRTNYPLTLVVDPAAELQLQMVYDAARFDADAIERLLSHLGNVLEAMIANIEQPVASLNLLSAAETKTLLLDWNGGQKESSLTPEAKPISRLFELQVKRTPHAIAVVHQSRQLTYAELNARANKLAHHLRKLGVGHGSLVGVCVERSIQMLVAVLAILKAGGAYLPLDPTYPKSRLDFMLTDGAVKLLITNDQLLQALPDYNDTIVCLDKHADLIDGSSDENLPEAANEDDLAYVIYTSGSTGNPKGTMIEHRSIVNFIEAASQEYAISPSDRVLQFASLCFDTSAEEIFPALTTGATVVLRTDAMLSSARDFLQACGEFEITVLDLPTAYWHELADELTTDNLRLPDSLRLVILGGEKAMPERLASWRRRANAAVRLINTYGPTETTVVATICDLAKEAEESSSDSDVPIGRPLRNTLVYILDPDLRPVPIGVPGELYIGGAGVARGYLHRPELTAEKFITNPFGDVRAPRLYKTGDLVRYRSDSNLEFLSRIDNQVKIRGFRVETGEIEQAIRSHALVSDVIVLVEEDVAGDKRLPAYVVAAQAEQPTTTELREFLSTKLPAYMLPSAFVMIENFPLLPNGKIDRQALPLLKPERRSPDVAVAAPRSPLEESVAKVWREVLKLEQVGINDNFFELGGHSLLGAKLISNLRRSLNCELSLIDVFRSPTIERLTEVIYQRQTESAAEEELSVLLAELQNLSEDEAQERLEQLISNGGSLAQTLKLAVATGTCAALEILSYTV